MTAKTNMNIVLGCMTFGDAKWQGMSVTDPKTANEMLNIFASHGHTELDEARMYGGGSSEEMLGNLDTQPEA